MVTAIREAEASLGVSVKRVTEAEGEMYALGRRSLVASRDVAAGDELQRNDIAIKRPGTGIPVHEIERVVGRRAKSAIVADQVLTWADLA